MSIDWGTVSELATAAGTLTLAVATFASIRSSNRSARIAERALLVGLRPVLMSSRIGDPEQKIGFSDDKWFRLAGSAAAAEIGDDAIYLAASVRNVGTGLAVLHGWRVFETRARELPPESDAPFHRLTRDLYIAAGDIGFWQGALRDPSEPEFDVIRAAIKDRDTMSVDLLYGDQDGGQHTITRLALIPHHSGDGWISTTSRHWNLDRADPR